MKEYQTNIDVYSQYNEAVVGSSRYGENWGNKEEAEAYLMKYWLPASEYQNIWHPIQDRIFIGHDFPSDVIFAPEYEIIAFRGGCLFTQDDFEALCRCIEKTGDNYFFVIENTFGKPTNVNEPSFRMKYPTNIDWQEMTSGNFISAMIVDYFNKDFFVFGDTAGWGQYATVRTLWPLNLSGYLPAFSDLFRAEFHDTGIGLKVLPEWIPFNYRDRVRCFL